MLSTGSFYKWLQQLGLGQAKTKNQEPEIPFRSSTCSYCSDHPWLLSQLIKQGAGLEIEHQISNQHIAVLRHLNQLCHNTCLSTTLNKLGMLSLLQLREMKDGSNFLQHPSSLRLLSWKNMARNNLLFSDRTIVCKHNFKFTILKL